MLAFCTILRQKFFVKRASLREKRDACNLSSLFFHCKKAHQTKVLALGTTKIVSISKRQATKQEKSQDAATSMEDQYKYIIHSEVEIPCVCTWRICWIPCPRGCRMSSGGRVIPPGTSKRAVHLMSFFQGQNCINKVSVKTRYTVHVVGLILCGMQCTVNESVGTVASMCWWMCIFIPPVGENKSSSTVCVP